MSEGNGLSLSSPGGWRLGITGREVILFAVIALGFTLTILSIRDLRADLAITSGQHAAITASQQNLVCILSLPIEERPAAGRQQQLHAGTICDYVAIYAADRQPGGRR